MLGYLWFFFWQALGLSLASRFFAEKRIPVQLWLGSVAGSVLSMWAPIPFAFLFGFGVIAHAAAAVCGGLGAVWLMLRRRPRLPTRKDLSCSGDRPLLWLLVPFFVLWVFLVWSHTLRDVGGALYTGQCTYGDMSMHLGFITSLAEQQFFPPMYSILPGTRISYPFLCDSVSASMLVLGTNLRQAYMFPMLFAFLQFAAGFWFLGREICRRPAAPVLAFLLFFLNGGLGMIYFIRDYSLHDLFTGFYKTPTNLTEKGMRWVNVIADMLLPQRATLFGWAALSAALYLLFRAVFRAEKKCALPAGVLGGLLPMIHTHSFFALGLIAACWMVYSACRDRFSRDWFSLWLRFGVTAVVLAFPQLMIWTFRSVGGNDSFLRVSYDWVNGGSENWFWFWLKNIGPLFVITPIAFIFANREDRAIFSGTILIFVLCELIVFQPNVYDNNKLLYVGYFFCCFLSSDALLGWLERCRGKAFRRVLLTVFLALSLNAGIFTLVREVLSGIPKYGYMLFSADEVAASEYILENTPSNAVILTDDNHDNPVAVLTGRNIVCGSASYLYYHGLEYTYQQRAAEQMLTNEEFLEHYKDEFGVDFVYMGYYEHALPNNIELYLQDHYPLLFSAGGINVYDLR